VAYNLPKQQKDKTMKKLNKTIVILAMLISMTLVSMTTNAEVIKEVTEAGEYLTTAYDGYQGSVPLRKYPNGTSNYARVPNGTKLLIHGKMDTVSGTAKIRVRWFKVLYNGKVGWISEYMTNNH
jgi:hypothetical protein